MSLLHSAIRRCRRAQAVAGFAVLASMGAGGVLWGQQFRQPVVVATGNWPSAVMAANLTAGTTSLLATDYGATSSFSLTRVFTAKGGSFVAGAAMAGAGAPVAADMVQGGHVDLVWVSVSEKTASVYRAPGVGDGTFDGAVLLTSFALSGGNAPALTLAVTGFRGGRRSVIVEDTANLALYQVDAGADASYALAPAAGQAGATLLAGAGQMLTADLNGDGYTDVVVQGANGVQVLLGSASGAMQSTMYPCTGTVASIALADVDGDGQMDLLAEGAAGRIDVYHGKADGTFASASEVGTGADNGLTGHGGRLVGVADLNGDGIPDLVTATPAGVSVLLGQAGLSYKLGGIYNAGPGRTSFVLADLNGDGHLDLAVDSPEGVAVLFGNADGSFQTSRAYATGQPAYSVGVGQFTGSGNLDAVVATGVPQLQFLAGDGAGGFAASGSPSPVGAAQTNAGRTLWSQVVVGDFDGDGKLDAALTMNGKLAPTTGDGMAVLFGNGDGTFGAPVAEAATAGSPHFGVSAVGDFDGDGVSDLANLDVGYVAAYGGGAAARGGSMARSMIFNDTSGSVPASDGGNFDADEYNLLATGFLSAGRTNKQDAVVQDDQDFYVFKNNGDGTFLYTGTDLLAPGNFVKADSAGNLAASGLYPAALVLADVDGDGYGDVVQVFHNLAATPMQPAAGTPNVIYVYWGQGDGSFHATPLQITPSRNYDQVVVTDVDGDGKPDLVLSDGYLIAVMYGQGNRTFGPEQHYLAGMGINLVAAADVNRDGNMDLVVANGGAVLSSPVATNGVLPANAEVNTGAVTVLLNLRAATAASGTLTASPEPSLYGDSFTLTATLTGSAGQALPTGTVTFSIDGAVVGTGAVTNGVATYVVPSYVYSQAAPGYVVGVHALSAVYGGDGNYSGVTLTGSHTVQGLPSGAYVTDLVTPILYGQVIGDTNGVNALLYTGVGAVGGTLTVYVDGASVCVLPANVAASCPDGPFSGFQVGTHTLVAVFSGDEEFAGSTSPTYPVVIVPDVTTALLTSSLNPSVLGQVVTFTAAVMAPYATPVGAVTFLDGTTAIGVAQVDANGVATFATGALAVGTHNISASYAGNTDFNGSVSNVVVQVVTLPVLATTTTLSSSVNPSVVGQNVVFTASVAVVGATTVPVGVVTFYDGTTVLGTVVLDATGKAVFATSTLAAGLHEITAAYAGNTITATTGSVSAVLPQQVNVPVPGAFTLTVTPDPVSVVVGNSVALTVTVTGVGGFSQPVQLGCSGLPHEAACAFGEGIVPAGGGSTQLVLSVAAPHSCGSNVPYSAAGGGNGLGLLLAALAGLAVFARRRKRLLQGLVLAAALVVLPGLSGCGENCTDLGVKPGPYSFTVTGTSTGTPVLTQAVVVKMVVGL